MRRQLRTIDAVAADALAWTIERDRRVATLFDAIAHGSEEHRAWLKQAIEDHFAGRPIEKPRG